MSRVSQSKLTVASGILRQASTKPNTPRDLDDLYSDVTDVGDLLASLASIIRELRDGLAGLPGIVDGLRVDPTFQTSTVPERLRDDAAAQLDRVADALGPLAGDVRAIDLDVAALFIDDYRRR